MTAPNRAPLARLALVAGFGLAALLPAAAHGIRNPADTEAAVRAAAGLPGDVVKGETTFRRTCQACHTMEPGGRHKVGPNLAGVLTRKPATNATYTYSEALREAPLSWDDPTLRRFLAYPFGVVPQTKMDYWLRSPADIADVIAYMRASPAARADAAAADTKPGVAVKVTP